MDMDVIVGLRGAGKTYRLVEWLTEGHEIPGRPKWSRMIIAAALDPKHYSHQIPSDLARRLWQVYPPGLRSLVISAKQMENERGGFPGVEFAVDDAEQLLPEWLTRLAGQGQLAGLAISGRSGSTIGRGPTALEVDEGGNLFTDNKIKLRFTGPPTLRGQFPV